MRISIGQQGQRRLCWPCTSTYIMVGVGIPGACWEGCGKVWEQGSIDEQYFYLSVFQGILLLFLSFYLFVFNIATIHPEFHPLKKPFICMKSFLHFLSTECFFASKFVAGSNHTVKEVFFFVRDHFLYVFVTGHQLATQETKIRKIAKENPWRKQCKSLCFTPGDLCIKTLFVLRLTQLWPLKRKYWTPIHPSSLFLCLPCTFSFYLLFFSLVLLLLEVS